MKTFTRTSLPTQIKYNNKVYVYGQKTSKSIKVEVLSRNLRGVRDLYGNYYKPSEHYFNPKQTVIEQWFDAYENNMSTLPYFSIELSKNDNLESLCFDIQIDEENKELFVYSDEADVKVDIDDAYLLKDHIFTLLGVLKEELKTNGYEDVYSHDDDNIKDWLNC